MKRTLFHDFINISSKQWKQLIQYELKGAEYNDSLVWESLEGIKVKPFYHCDEDTLQLPISTPYGFSVVQPIFVQDVEKSNARAIESLQRGAESILFTLPNTEVSPDKLLKNIPMEGKSFFFNCTFLEVDTLKRFKKYAEGEKPTFYYLNDPVGHLMKDGNWFENLSEDMKKLNHFQQLGIKNYLAVDTTIVQNAGGNMVQQLAYGLAHMHEYVHHLDALPETLVIQTAVGSNYFFEIAKNRAFRWLLESYFTSMGLQIHIVFLTTPTKRNKTLYDYNVNMLRTTTECMSAILGGSDFVMNLPYDALYHKDNEFGDRISRNQLLILKHESYFNEVFNASEGSYYIENLTKQLAEKGLELFKELEKNGGLITQLIEGTIQRKIEDNAEKELQLFTSGKEVLVGTNKYPNSQDRMKNDLELYPFVKTQTRKTLIKPIIEKRWAEKLEQERLTQES